MIFVFNHACVLTADALQNKWELCLNFSFKQIYVILCNIVLSSKYTVSLSNSIARVLINTHAGSADPRLLGALRKTVSPGGWRREWMNAFSCFTPSPIALTESAWETVSLPWLGIDVQLVFFLFFYLEPCLKHCTTFMLHDLTDFYIERVTAHCIKRKSCFQTLRN